MPDQPVDATPPVGSEPADVARSGVAADNGATNGPQTPGAAASPDQPLAGADLARRRFFRRFAGDVVTTAATLAGAATALQRASAEAASTLLDPERDEAALRAIAGVPASSGAADPAAAP
ncbi:MAG TPA: hypothetical protein VGC90_04325, partial [Candidatus Limnocylindrales bacterium]